MSRFNLVTLANGTLSPTEFDVTFNGYVNGGGGRHGRIRAGATVDAAMVVTNCAGTSGGGCQLRALEPGGSAVQPGGVRAAGHDSQAERERVPGQSPVPTTIYTQNIRAPQQLQPAVAMDGSGDFVITWAEQVREEVSPKDMTDIYFRLRAVGVSLPSGTTVPVRSSATW